MAIAVGLLIAAAFLGALMWKPVAVLALVVLICGLAAIEFFDKVTEKGYRPATVIGILAAVTAPLAGYWVGESALALVMVLAMITTAFTFVGATGLHSSPIPNMSITSLGVMWIGLMGSYAALLAGVSNTPLLDADGGFTFTAGTDTLFIIAVGVVANDVGALFVGSAAGSTPLRQWISPNKTVEGLMGGTVATFFAMWIVGLQSDTWNDIGEIVVLALAVAILAPLGDLVESMFKRNLEIKDFGTLVKGHGGVLDRFDGFLFVLPAAYYLLLVFEPYAS
jgi:phosphatidate cytidylyltransferase